jgi:hypothetical protein
MRVRFRLYELLLGVLALGFICAGLAAWWSAPEPPGPPRLLMTKTKMLRRPQPQADPQPKPETLVRMLQLQLPRTPQPPQADPQPKRETLELRITKRGDHIIDKCGVTLQIKDVVRDEDGCIAAFTVPEQTVKVELPQGRYGVNIHAKPENQKEDLEKALKRMMEEISSSVANPP